MSFWRRNKGDKFSSSILGLDKSIEELQAQEAAVERELGVRFSKAIEKTRDSINNRLDQVFEGRKQIDEGLLDELEEVDDLDLEDVFLSRCVGSLQPRVERFQRAAIGGGTGNPRRRNSASRRHSLKERVRERPVNR